MADKGKEPGIGEFQLKISGNHECAYLKLPNFPRDTPAKSSRSFRLIDVIGKYKGPDVIFDFDQSEKKC